MRITILILLLGILSMGKERTFDRLKLNGTVYYEPQEKQKVFHDAILNRDKNGLRDFLYGGAARGGKSYALRWEAHRNCIENERLRGLLIRSSFPELERSHLAQLKFDLPADMLKYNQQKHVAYYWNGSALEFGYGTSKEDFQQYLSAEYDFIMIDELTTIPFEFSYLLRSRLTGSRKDFIPFYACATNPGSIAHVDVRNYFVRKSGLDPELFPAYNPDEVFFVPATVYDNKIVIERDPGEVTRLKQLSKRDQQKFLFGNWDIYEGQFFDNWNSEVHVIKPKYYLPDYQLGQMRVLGGLDYGNTTVLVFGAKDYNGNVVVFDELYMDKFSRDKKIAYTKDFLSKRKLTKATIIADTNMWIPDSFDIATSHAPAQEYLDAGINVRKVSKTVQDKQRRYRIACNDAVYNALDHEMDPETGLIIRQPKIKFYERCKMLIETIPALVRDDKDLEDIADKQNDHGYDAMKYMYMALTEPGEPIEDKNPTWLKELNKQNSERSNFMVQ